MPLMPKLVSASPALEEVPSPQLIVALLKVQSMSATRFVNAAPSVAVMLSPLAAEALPGQAVSARRANTSAAPAALLLGPLSDRIASPSDWVLPRARA